MVSLSVRVPDITIKVVGLGVTDKTVGLKKIRKQIHLAILRGIRRCINDAITLARIIVPEAIEREPPYPASYFVEQSEELMESWITFMKKQIRAAYALTRELHDKYEISQDWEASYAKYVNEMTGVNWSKAGSHGKFIEELDNFIRSNLQVYIHEELQKADQGEVLLYTVS